MAQILINKTHVSPRRKISEGFDIELIGNADSVIQCLIDHNVFPAKVKRECSQVEPQKLAFSNNVWLFDGSDRAEVEKAIANRSNMNILKNICMVPSI